MCGERGYTPLEQRSARPTFEINGLTSGYQGEGSKTIVPAWARAKVTARLVPGATPMSVNEVLRWPGVLTEPSADPDELAARAHALVDEVLGELAASRAREECDFSPRSMARCSVLAYL